MRTLQIVDGSEAFSYGPFCPRNGSLFTALCGGCPISPIPHAGTGFRGRFRLRFGWQHGRCHGVRQGRDERRAEQARERQDPRCLNQVPSCACVRARVLACVRDPASHQSFLRIVVSQRCLAEHQALPPPPPRSLSRIHA